jgi:hypothetical protein
MFCLAYSCFDKIFLKEPHVYILTKLCGDVSSGIANVKIFIQNYIFEFIS